MTDPRPLSTSVRGLAYHLHQWPAHEWPAQDDPAVPLVVLVHGWMDTGASFGFLIDAMIEKFGTSRRYVALDWRGHGRSARGPESIYRYADYLADLDTVVERLAGDSPVAIVGHSLGGNVAALYAAARPERVRAFVNLEGFGLRESHAKEMPEFLTNWLDVLHTPAHSRPYRNLGEVALRVRALSTRISDERALAIAAQWAEQGADGQWRLRVDPALRRGASEPYRSAEFAACWQAIKAPVLWVEADQSENLQRHALTPERLAERRANVPNLRLLRVADAGHMVHWEYPELLADAIGPFLLECGT